MSHQIDISSQDALATLFDADFYTSLKQYLGYPPSVANSDLPFNINDLLDEAVAVVESLQWRSILRKNITLSLPCAAFQHRDRMLYIPFSTIVSGDVISFSVKQLDGSSLAVSLSGITFRPTTPSSLFHPDWLSLFGTPDPLLTEPITLVYTAGYSSYTSLPRATITSLKLWCAHTLKEREIITDSDAIAGFSKGGAFDTYVAIDSLYNSRAYQYITGTRK